MHKNTLSEGVYPIGDAGTADAKADIVFLHGLGGDAHSTWRHGKPDRHDHFFWPAELAKDFPTCSVWTVGYPAGLTAWGERGMPIEMRAGNVARKLLNAGLGLKPLIFITHSMGGLIVKHLIVDSQTQPDTDRKQLVEMIQGIVFCATPHRGSDYVDATRVLSLFFGGLQSHVREMRDDAERLDLLHDKFIEWHRMNPIPIKSYAENIGLFRKAWWFRTVPLGLVVTRSSANPNVPQHPVDDVDYDHLSMVKPHDRGHDVYRGVHHFISRALNPKVEDSIVSRFGPKPTMPCDDTVQDWFSSIDSGMFETAYDGLLSQLAQARFPKETFLELLRNERAPLGRVLSRKLGGSQSVTALPGWPTAYYECRMFRTEFANGGERQENIVMLGDHGSWRVLFHQIGTQELSSRLPG